jgi:hypothetical protein
MFKRKSVSLLFYYTTNTREYCGSERGHWTKSTPSCASPLCVGLSEASVRRILHKDLHFYPYKFQVTRALNERDNVNRSFCQTFFQFEIHVERSQKCHRFCKTRSQQKYIVLQSTAPLQTKRFKVGSKMATAATSPVLANQKKHFSKSPDSLTHPVHYALSSPAT